MKKVIIFIVAVFCVFTAVSCTSLQGADIGTYQEILTADGMTGEELYSKAQAWFVDSFVDSSDVIELQDREAGIIKGKYIITIPRNALCKLILECVVTVEIKDGKARLTVSAPVSSYAQVGYNRTGVTGYTAGEVENINAERQALYESFKNYIISPSAEW